MRVLVCNLGVLDSPEVSLILAIRRLGHTVDVVGYGLDQLPQQILLDKGVVVHDIGSEEEGVLRMLQQRRVRRRLVAWLEGSLADYDVVWTTNEITVRELSSVLVPEKHIMQLYELCQYVPAFARRDMPFHAASVPAAARAARRVVVPEYNRACIQQVWWNLPVRPTVLPNRPLSIVTPSSEAVARAEKTLGLEGRKVVLYQGIFSEERDLAPFVEAMNLLGGEFVLALQGKVSTGEERRRLDSFCRASPHVRYLGFERTPDHLAFTHLGNIGLMVYRPGRVEYVSELNGLYCAPNKIWEYAAAGLPMISNDLPGLRGAFEQYDMGRVVALDPEEIAVTLREIDSQSDRMSEGARNYYESVDVEALVCDLLSN